MNCKLVSFATQSAMALSLLAAVMACSISDKSSTVAEPERALYFPEEDANWESLDPQVLGWDERALEKVFEFAQEHNSSGLVILHKGRVVAQRHWRIGNPPVYGELKYRDLWYHGESPLGWAREDVASAQKSVISVLAGIAWDRGLLDLDAPVTRYLGHGWSKASESQEGAITVRHLLSMASGLTEELEYVFPAGEDWAYINKAYSLVNDVIQAASGREPNDFTREWLTGPLGMTQTEWVTRGEVFRRWNVNGLVTTAPDLARFGLMILAGGKWNDQRIVSQAYLQQALSPSTPYKPSYGLLFWLNNPRGLRGVKTPTSVKQDKVIEAAPADWVSALGHSDRRSTVVPSMGLVVSRTGNDWKLNPDRTTLPQFSFDEALWRLLRLAIPEMKH